MPLTKLDVGALATIDPQPIPWLVQDMIAQGRVTMIYGEGGLGKSLLAMACAQAITDGLPFLGRSTRRRRVVMIDSENGEHLLHLRVKQLGLARNAEAYDARGFNIERHQAELVHVLNEEFAGRPGLVVLDSLRSLAPDMDENDTGSTNRVLKGIEAIARELEVAVLIVHHANRGGSMRGSSALRDQVDVLLGMGRDLNDSRRGRRFVRWEKNRLGAEPAPQWLEILSDEWSNTITVVGAYHPSQD